MIAQLTGVVVRTEANSVVMDVNGVGYLVFVPISALAGLPQSGGKVTLITHLVMRGQPDFDMTLYGFESMQQMQSFKMLIRISGVGPKVALALLSSLKVSELARALSTNDTRALTKVAGVGPKLALRLCAELGDQMAGFALEQSAERAPAGTRTSEANAVYEDVIEALVNLGYGRSDARRATDRVIAASGDRSNANTLIPAALQILTSGR